MPSQKQYQFRDKYFGRTLDDKSFEDALRAFFTNGAFRSSYYSAVLSGASCSFTVVRLDLCMCAC